MFCKAIYVSYILDHKERRIPERMTKIIMSAKCSDGNGTLLLKVGKIEQWFFAFGSGMRRVYLSWNTRDVCAFEW